MSTTWLEVMPAIPLARAVPVVWSEGESWSRSVALHEHHTGRHGSQLILTRQWRVDLGEPQGFAYALRWYSQMTHASSDSPAQRAEKFGVRGGWNALGRRWMLGTTTDADRFALATALAEVTR